MRVVGFHEELLHQFLGSGCFFLDTVILREIATQRGILLHQGINFLTRAIEHDKIPLVGPVTEQLVHKDAPVTVVECPQVVKQHAELAFPTSIHRPDVVVVKPLAEVTVEVLIGVSAGPVEKGGAVAFYHINGIDHCADGLAALLCGTAMCDNQHIAVERHSLGVAQ